MREVDIAISMDRPDTGDIGLKKLTSYALGIYGRRLISTTGPAPRPLPICRTTDGYTMDLRFTTELDLLTFGGQAITPWYRTTSASVQLKAVTDGSAIAVLPCYMVLQRDGLERLLSGEVSIERTYWIAVHKANSPRVRRLVQQIERHVHLDKSLFLPGGVHAEGEPATVAEA